MSGLEVAGLVLGAIPLIVEGFKIYANSVSTIERYRKYKNNLQDLYRELDSEYVTYQNTCEQLLDGLVDDLNQKADLLNHPGGKSWRNANLDEKLRKRLDRSYGSYVEIVKDMNASLEKIKALLKLGKDGKVQIDGGSKFREEYHRLKFSIKKKDYDELVARITRHNEKLSKLTDQNRSLEPSRFTSFRRISDSTDIQTYASHLFDVLNNGFRCGCPASHSISLKLEDRNQRGESRRSASANNLPRFRIIVSYTSKLPVPQKAPWILEALDVQPFDQSSHDGLAQTQKPKMSKKSVTFAVESEINISSTVDTATASIPEYALPIRNLCQAISGICSASEGDCIGLLEDRPSNQTMALFQTSCSDQSSRKPSLLSLSSIISSNQVDNAPFSWSDKLRVAVALAYSLLQLHHTLWLDETWGKEDISLLEGCETYDIFSRLFVSRKCDEGGKQGSSDDAIGKSWEVIRSRPLFSLGILLIELCVGRPFENIRKERVSSVPIDPSSVGFLDFAVADQLVDTCYLERGMHYGDAVRRCIRCTFDTRNTDLEDMQFRQAVYDGIVAPLEEDLKNFGGLCL